MIVLLDTSHDLATCKAELGCDVGQLLTPLTRFTLRDRALPWAIDNGAFSKFNPHAFLSLLEREDHDKTNCLFVVAPDVVGSARRTSEIFQRWQPHLHGRGYPIAYVAQDGQEDIPVPWDAIAAIFIGGSTQWKVSSHAVACIKAAQALEKWVHVGRVNDPSRFAWCEELGVDSVDGSGIGMYSHMRDAIARRHHQQEIFAYAHQA